MRRLLAPLSRWLDRLIDAQIAANEKQAQRDLDASLRSTWADFGPEMRRVFGSEDAFRQAILTGRLAR